MSTQTPALIQPLLDAYLSLTDRRLPGFLTGFYLHGSIALDAFNERFSDIDFVAVISRPATASDLSHLREIHRTISRDFPRWPLEGCYLQPAVLGQSAGTIAPHPNYHDGKLDPAARFDANGVTWWILKNHGIALLGPEPDTLTFQVDWAALIAEMHINLNTYWARWSDSPNHLAWLLLDGGVQWVVLGVLRQFYSFRESGITSKTGAGEYALAHLPGEWHRLIREAIRCREGCGPSLYRSRIMRAAEAVRFLRRMIATCNDQPDR